MIDGAVELRADVEEMMNRAWTEPGFCVPNQATYPHQWLWDSCFHALVWSELGSDRGVTEVASALARQADDGFVPHMIYWTNPELHAEFWGRPGTSSITQPPMYGHAIAELTRAGFDLGPDVGPDLIERAKRGLLHLGARQRTPDGLIPVFHPWETGCDDSARWDHWLPETGATPSDRAGVWREQKGRLVAALQLSTDGHAIGSEKFVTGSVGFNALVAWNASELLDVLPGGDAELAALRDDIGSAVARRRRGDRWIDDGPASGRVRTLDGLLALLVDPQEQGFAALVDRAAFGAPFGPRGVHADEPSYEPEVYWRGPAWPQLSYLLMVAAERAGHETALALAMMLVDGARRSGLAEYWHPETGRGLGARPQSWAGLGLVAERSVARLTGA